MHSPLRMGSLHAFCDAVYLDPDYRGHGIQLIRWCDRELAALGVVKAFISDRPRVRLGHGRTSGRLGKVLTRLGYTESEVVYAKLLGDHNVRRKQSP